MKRSEPQLTILDEREPQHANDANVKTTQNGIKLEPQPNGPEDPLNWSSLKKAATLGILCLCAFVGQCQGQASTAGIVVQAKVYHKTPTELAYGTSAAVVGIATGPIFWLALSNYIGRTSTTFWALLGALGCSIWSSAMTNQDQYVPFVISRWLGATCSVVGSTFGASLILDMFYLHQRRKAFACYTTSILLGVNVGATLSGFIAGTAPWPAQYWWVIGALGLCIMLVALFLEDTTYDRENQQKGQPGNIQPSNYFQRRLTLLFAGQRMVSPSSVYHGPFDSIIIGLQPVTILAGLFSMITFGWAVAVTTLVPVFLQSPISEGGYGFTPVQQACFTFVTWITALIGELHGVAFNDRIPLWLCRRNGGVWKAEYRLAVLLPTVFLLPVGLGIFGAGLQYHLPWEVLALGVLLLNSCEIAMTPIISNYVSECFAAHPSEVFVILQLYRLVLGLTVAFSINPWVAAVGPGWAFGMMGFFCLIGFGFTGLLWWKGPVIRRWSLGRFRYSEDGDILFGGARGQGREEAGSVE